MFYSNLVSYLGCKEALWVHKGREAGEKGRKKLLISITVELTWKCLGRWVPFARDFALKFILSPVHLGHARAEDCMYPCVIQGKKQFFFCRGQQSFSRMSTLPQFIRITCITAKSEMWHAAFNIFSLWKSFSPLHSQIKAGWILNPSLLFGQSHLDQYITKGFHLDGALS